jgi:hypothetical protein
MQPEEFPLTPETLRRFVPFDELSPEARTQLVPQAEILRIPQDQQVGEAALDPRYTLYLLDGELALTAGDRLVDTLRGGSPICRFPLSRLRSGQLSAKTNTSVRLLRLRRNLVSQLLNAQPRPNNPNQPSSSATGADSVSPSRMLAAMEAVNSPTSRKSGEQEQPSTELARTDTEIESALQDKAEATIARRLWASGFHGLETAADDAESSSLESQMAHLLARQAHLEERSRRASEALAKAQRKKLECEAAFRAVETNHAQNRAKSEAIGEQLPLGSEPQARNNEQHLEDQYRRISMKLEQLEETRRAAEQRLAAERRQLEEAFARTRSRLQKEAADIQAALDRAREKTVEHRDAIPGAQTVGQEHLRIEVKMRLRQARSRLEAEHEQSELALLRAQQELDAAHLSKHSAEQEAQQLAWRLEAKEADAKDARRALVSPRHAVIAKAHLGTDERGTPHPKAEDTPPRSQHPGGLNDGEGVTAEFTEDRVSSAPEEKRRVDLGAIEHKLARADSRVTAAAHAREKAAQAKWQVEEQVARHRAVEDELRLEIYEEKEKRLRAECERSDAEADDSVALVEAMAGRTFAYPDQSHVQTNEVMMVDIRQQLKQGVKPPPVTQGVQNKTEAERRAAIARAAQEKAKAERLKAKQNLQRAREHLIELRTKMQKPHSSNSN